MISRLLRIKKYLCSANLLNENEVILLTVVKITNPWNGCSHFTLANGMMN